MKRKKARVKVTARPRKPQVRRFGREVRFGWENYTGSGTTTYVGRHIWSNRLVEIQSEEEPGKILATLPAYGYNSDWDAIKEQYPVTTVRNEGGEVVTTVHVRASESYLVDVSKASKKSPLMCVYTAVEDYCSRMLGIKLGSEDREFFIEHPLVDEDGVSFSNTLRVVQELVDPYGIRISKVRLAPGQALKGDVQQWRHVLGINPIALTDRNTTNAEFWDGKPATQLYNFEYNAAPLSPSISCGVMGQVSGVTGSTGGHATFVPPRKGASGALLQFQLARAEGVLWKKPPVFEPLPQEDEKMVNCFDIDEWYRKHRKWGAELDKWREERGLATKKEKEATGASVSTFRSPKRYLGSHSKVVGVDCFACNRHAKDLRFSSGVPGVCDGCWSNLVANFFCQSCHHVGNTEGTPPFKYVNYSAGAERIMVQCNSGCHKVYHFDGDDKKNGKQIKKLIRAMHDYDVDRVIDEAERTRLSGTESVGNPELPDPADASPKEEAPTQDANTQAGTGEPLL